MTIKRRKAIPKTTAVVTVDHTYDEDVKGGRHPLLHGQHQDVYQFISANPYCTREDVSRGTGLRSSTATARIKELIDEGFVTEPPGHRKVNRSGVKAKTLHVTHRATGGKPLDKVRVEVQLTVDMYGHYAAHARVIGQKGQIGTPVPIKKQRLTMTAPHPDTYRSAFGGNVSVAETEAHAEDIIDAEYVEVDKN